MPANAKPNPNTDLAAQLDALMGQLEDAAPPTPRFARPDAGQTDRAVEQAVGSALRRTADPAAPPPGRKADGPVTNDDLAATLDALLRGTAPTADAADAADAADDLPTLDDAEDADPRAATDPPALRDEPAARRDVSPDQPEPARGPLAGAPDDDQLVKQLDALLASEAEEQLESDASEMAGLADLLGVSADELDAVPPADAGDAEGLVEPDEPPPIPADAIADAADEVLDGFDGFDGFDGAFQSTEEVEAGVNPFERRAATTAASPTDAAAPAAAPAVAFDAPGGDYASPEELEAIGDDAAAAEDDSWYEPPEIAAARRNAEAVELAEGNGGAPADAHGSDKAAAAELPAPAVTAPPADGADDRAVEVGAAAGWTRVWHALTAALAGSFSHVRVDRPTAQRAGTVTLVLLKRLCWLLNLPLELIARRVAGEDGAPPPIKSYVGLAAAPLLVGGMLLIVVALL